MIERKVLVTGGAGYIGAHTVVELLAEGFQPVILDNLSRSDERLLKGIQSLTGKAPVFHQADCSDVDSVRKVFSDHGSFLGVLHFAALKSVGESVREPLLYYRNNMLSMIALLEVMEEFNVTNLIFSSSCTVYGEPDKIPVSEQSPIKAPESPYGATKQMCEQVLKDAAARGVRTISLRYFNPIGAHPSSMIGELPMGVPSNLVPYITQTAAGKRKELIIFGGDYNTPDGSCVRDYIHVVDLARAHVKALNYLETISPGGHFDAFNLGTGKGVSVLDLVKKFTSVTGVKFPYRVGPRRPGDVEKTFADPGKANKVLDWRTEFSIEQALSDAWKWEQTLNSR
jgi:UDP-glucose 4-epimerase